METTNPLNIGQRSSTRRRRTIASLKIAACILTLLVLAREAGVISLTIYRSNIRRHMEFSSNQSYSLDSYASQNAQNLSLEKVSLPTSLSYVEEAIAVRLRALEDRVGAKYEAQLSVSELQVNLSGLYWVPLYKTASVTFEATWSLQVAGPGLTLDVEEKIHGDATAKVSGLCSVRTFQEIVGSELGEALSKRITSKLSQVALGSFNK